MHIDSIFNAMDSMDMLNEVDRKITYVPPFPSHPFEKHTSNKERKSASVLESIYWQTIGWVHTPPFIKAKLEKDSTFELPKSSVESQKYRSHTKKSFAPKLQIENRVPYGFLPKDIVSDIEKRRFTQQDLKTILNEMGIEKEAILPLVLYYRDSMKILKKDYLEGIPSQPFLDLDMFDDVSYYESYSAEEWLSLGDTEKGRKSLPGLAFIPEQKNKVDEYLNFDWFKVIVFDYDSEKKLYLVRRDLGHQEDDDGNSSCDDNKSEDLWIPRIYLKFEAEEPYQFAKRFQNALYTRHIMEESLRLNYYIECMPLENTPEWPEEDLNSILEMVRSSRSLQPKLQWIKDHLIKSVPELQLEYKKAYNYMCYIEIANQSPNLLKDFRSKNLVGDNISGSKVHIDIPFAERYESFRCKTFYTCVEAIHALNEVEANILTLRNKSLYNLSLNDTYALETFDFLQKTELSNIYHYVHDTWISVISQAIQQNLGNCGKGDYDLNQTVLHTFKFTKLGKLLKMISLKMQDVIRFLILESLGKYTEVFRKTCSSVLDVKDDFTWTDSLNSNQFSPPGNPVFEVPLDIKGDRLHFIVDLQQYEKTIKELFDDGLNITKDLMKIEKFVMKKMLYNPDDKLETVGEKEKQIIQWSKEINHGISRAIIVATAYIRIYDDALKSFKTDQINYVKYLARKKATCDELKQVIEMHHTEKVNLTSAIPSFVDIGPFRLLTSNVRESAIKKHEQLADAVLNYFYTKLRQHMEALGNKFLVLIDRIEQPTGNVEGLVEKKQWCRTVPKKIEKCSEEVNRLRSDVKLISTFHRNMDDDDCNTYWQIQKLPQITMQKLNYRISQFDEEKDKHKENLISDQNKLKTNLKNLRAIILRFTQHSDLEKVLIIATDIRKARKSLTKYDEQSQLYQKREQLFDLPITEYPEIAEISESLLPFENFWLSAAEFNKYEEIDDADLLTKDPSELRKVIEEFHSNLQNSMKNFDEESYPDIHKSILTVLEDVEKFIATRLK